jgi:hypothetical protein
MFMPMVRPEGHFVAWAGEAEADAAALAEAGAAEDTGAAELAAGDALSVAVLPHATRENARIATRIRATNFFILSTFHFLGHFTTEINLLLILFAIG